VFDFVGAKTRFTPQMYSELAQFFKPESEDKMDRRSRAAGRE
jgi:hypothetical protein